MRLYSVEVLIRAKQQIVVAAEDEDFAMDKAQDRIDLKEAVIDDMGKKLGFEEGGEEGETASEEVAEPVDEEAAFNQGFAQEQQARGV